MIRRAAHLPVGRQLQIRLASTTEAGTSGSSEEFGSTGRGGGRGGGQRSGGGTGMLPFPTYANPTPHQIFHLPHGASKADIKARYYDLVRQHHPDSPQCRHLSPQARHARFQSIRAAYDHLTGKGAIDRTRSPWGTSYHPKYGAYSYREGDEAMYEELARRRADFAHARNGSRAGFQDAYSRGHERTADWAYGGNAYGPASSGWSSSSAHPSTYTPDAAWKDKLLILGGALALVLGFGPFVVLSASSSTFGSGSGGQGLGAMSPMRMAEERHRSAAQNLAEARRDAREWGMVRRREIRRRVEGIKKRREAEEGGEAELEEGEEVGRKERVGIVKRG